MNIYILEDDIYHQNRIQEVLKQIEKMLGISLYIKVVTSKPQELYEQMTVFGKDQIYLLDIELKGQEKKGLEVAREIRKKDDEAAIIFVTTHSEYAAITYYYQVAALGFVNKEVETSKLIKDIAQNIQVVLEKNSLNEADFFEVKTKSRHIRVPLENIYSIETTGVSHKLLLYTDTQRIEFYESMKNIEKKYPMFFRTHKAFLINPGRVAEIDKVNNIVYLRNGSEILISRRRIKALEQRLS